MTAEEILIKNNVLVKTIEESGNFPLNLTRDTHIKSAKDIKKSMIEFAKYHVEQALKEASLQSKVDSFYKPHYKNAKWRKWENEEIDALDNDTKYAVNKNSIKNSYPIDKIK